ncbi:MAG: ABC transporter substrate-binding protein, partial [Pseudomonadota bacterium]
MRTLKHTVSAAALAAAIATVPLAADAQSVLRLDEVAVGELDPAKATDFADTMLMFNAYDTLLLPAQGTGGLVPHLASDYSVDGNDFTFTLRDDVSFESGNPLTADDVVYSYDRLI